MSTNIADTIIEELSAPREGVKAGEKLQFGKSFADRMFYMEYTPEKGWYNKKICQHEDLNISPATMVFHYGQEIFEGLKAYRRQDGQIGLFRAADNFERMNNSAKIMCMPTLPPTQEMVEILKKLIKLEERFIPEGEGESLYIRPTMIGADPYIGLKSSNKFIFYIILSPVGAYYPNGFSPNSILVEDSHSRTAPGGIGSAKAGANYAASLLTSKEATDKGFDQVLWLDGKERKYVEEVGTSNIFFVYGNKLVTPKLNGSILPGITRDSVLQLSKSWGLETIEESLEITKVLADIESGKVTECFASGTAAVISPTGKLTYKGKEFVISSGKIGEYTQKFFNSLTAIQYGKSTDMPHWVIAY